MRRLSHRSASRRIAIFFSLVAITALALVATVVPLSSVSSPLFVESRLFGGGGDQAAVAATVSGGQLYVASQNASALSGVMGRFAMAPGLAQAWNNSLGNITSFAGIAPHPGGGAVAVGSCLPGACGAADGVGGTEAKIGIARFDANGNLLFARSANIFAYRGSEALSAATTVIEGGLPFVYAVGFGEPCSFGLNVFTKFDGNGTLIAKATEPGLEPNFTANCAVFAPGTSATADGVVAAAGSIYVAGASANRPGDGDNVLRPVILKYDTNLNRQWKQRYNDVAGQLFGITEAGGALYAVGYAIDGGTQQYLVQKYDLAGVRIWSQILGGGGVDVLNEVIVAGGRLFAVGKSNSPGTDGFDGTIMEFDPATGNPLGGTSLGGPLDQSLNGITTDGTDLYVVGETRLAVGNEALVARYSLSGPQTTVTTLSASPNPSAFGANVVFTATVSAGASLVTQGTVAFKEGATIIGGPINLDASGQATLNTSSLSPGPHTIVAEYSGDPAFATSSGSVSHTVNKANTTTALTSSANPSVFGQNITLTAIVGALAPGSGTPAGSVQFMDGGTNLGGPVPLINGVASLTTPSLGVGPHALTAVYSGDSGFNASQGNSAQTVNKADTATTLTSSQNPSQFGQSVTFTASVTALAPAAVMVTGHVQFKDNGAPMGGSIALTGGAATFTLSTLGGGLHVITAEFLSNTSFNSSAGTVNQTVNKAPTTTTLSSSPNPSNATNSVFFTAHVARQFGPVAAGSVTLKEGMMILAGPSPVNPFGMVNFNLSTLLPGSHLITAEYSGTSELAASSGSTSHHVNALTPFININTNTFTFDGNPHPATATAMGQNGVAVNGTFTFTYSPGGANEPVNAGAYGVTATFTSADPNYANAVATLAATPGGGTWTTRAGLPTARYGPPTAVINNKIYVASGCCVSGTTRHTTLEVYDPAPNTWSSRAPIPVGVYGAGTGVINGIMYVAAGQQAGGNVSNLQAYDPVSNSWSAKLAMTDASAGVGAAVVNNLLYVIGGMNPSNTVAVNLVRRYDPVANAWTARAAMPTAREFMGVATSNNRIYVVGGYNGSAPLGTLEVYDANSNTWSTRAPMPTPRYGLTVEFLNGILYAIGGNAGVGGAYQPLATIETYDPNTDTWSTLDAAPATRYLAGSGQVFGTLYLIGGVDTNGSHSTRNDAFMPDRLLRINRRQPTISVSGGTFPYDQQPHPATATAIGLGGAPVAGTFSFNYSPGGSAVPITAGFYGVNATFTSADSNYQSGGTSFASIQITRAPAVVNVPGNITVEADAGADGAQVGYVVTAHDLDGPLTPNCNPPSGSFFDIGTRTVTCTAQGVNSSQGMASFQVTVNEPTVVSIAVKTMDGASSATINVNDTKQFVATATFSNGQTRSTDGSQSGGGGGGNGGGGDPGYTPNVGFWNVHFTPGLSVAACTGIPGGNVSFSSQSLGVDSTGQIVNTQWSPGTPTVNVTGQVTANQQISLTLRCISDPNISTTAILPWYTTSFDGPITFSGVTTMVHVTGWSSQPPMPTPAFASGSAVIGNTLYMAGGAVNGAPSGLVQVFNLATRGWESPAAPMLPREGPGVAALNGFLYVAGGHMPGGDATKTLQRYDPAINLWVLLPEMPTARAELQLVAAGGKLYAIGGQPGNGNQPPLSTVERYDPLTNAWDTLSPMATPRMFFAAGALNSDSSIIAVGSNGSGPSAEVYNIASNSWSPTIPLPLTMTAGVSIANRFYVASQCGTFVYRPASLNQNEGWAIMPNMLNPRSEFAVAAGGDVMYAAGGFSGSAQPAVPLSTFDALSTPAPSDLFYQQSSPINQPCNTGGGDGGGDDDSEGPVWRVVDPDTHVDAPIASVDDAGLVTGLAPGTVLVVAEFGGVSCLHSDECATLTIGRYSPVFAVADASASYGDASVTLTGTLGAGSLYPSGGEVTITVNGEVATAIVDAAGGFTATIDTHAFNAGTYPVSYSFGGNALFNGASNNVTALHVAKLTATVAADAKSKVYGEANPPLTATVTGTINGDTLDYSLATSADEGSGAGSYVITVTLGDNPNYLVSPIDGTLTVTPASLVVTANDATTLLGAPLPAFTASYAGFVNGDSPSSLAGTLTFTTTATASSPVGTYAVTPGGLTSPNYDIAFVAGTLTIKYNICTLYDAAKVHASGSVIQISLQLCDASGNNVSAAGLAVQATNLVLVSTNVAGTPEAPGNSNPDNNFRLTTNGGVASYVYNLSTRGLAMGTYHLEFTVSGDGSVYAVPFQVR